ncbi:MAG: hypothetical protein WA790_02295 [Sulfitobacter sp.]
MSNITGITINFETPNASVSPSGDKLFLGIYSKYGGREFRVNYGVDINLANASYEIGLGSPCCASDNIYIVDKSTGGGVNDPTLNPLNLKDVKFIYLRKETADSSPVDDNWLMITNASVLLCDGRGGLRRFAIRDQVLNFCDEGGLQHWLPETEPPQVKITLATPKVSHFTKGGKRVGDNWKVNLSASVKGQTINNPLSLKPNENGDNWEFKNRSIDTIDVRGCCGETFDVVIDGWARERDFFSKDEFGSAVQTIQVTSMPVGTSGASVSGSIEVEVKKTNGKRTSYIQFDYKLTAECLS